MPWFAFASACLASGALVASTSALAAGPQRDVPFQATLSFQETLAPGSATCALTSQISGTGDATGIGPVTLSSNDCINPLPPSYSTFSFASTNVVLTAGNGDQLWAAYTGLLSAQGTITGGYAIYGGTGHFAGAKGFGTLQGYEALAPTGGSGQIQLQGTMRH